MKCMIALISQSGRSLSTITGCLHGVSENSLWKYGLEKKKYDVIKMKGKKERGKKCSPHRSMKVEYGIIRYLQADKTTLWALNWVFSQTSVTSTRVSFCRSTSMASIMWTRWLFHRRLYCGVSISDNNCTETKITFCLQIFTRSVDTHTHTQTRSESSFVSRAVRFLSVLFDFARVEIIYEPRYRNRYW